MASSRPPVILLGGDTNALAIARSLGTFGVTVHTIGAASWVESSRFVTPIRVPASDRRPEDVWADLLLDPAAKRLHGAVVLGTSDVGITTLTRYRAALEEHYLLDVSDVPAQLAMLDKLTTYEAARAAEVPTPLFWRVDSPADLARWRSELVYPLIVKPLLSHEYKAKFPGLSKFRVVHDFAELEAGYQELADAGLAVMLVEKIPGGDEMLCSYTTYVDKTGSATFDFTKRMIRRNPPNEGLGCYHVTDWNPEVKEVTLRMLKHVGLRGPAAVEFVRDARDGRLKLIECNARFSAALPLIVASGIDLPRHVYLQVLGERHELPRSYRPGRRLLYPSDDLRSFLALRKAGKLTFLGWLRSLAHPQSFPVWSPRDPAPAVARAWTRLRRVAQLAGSARRTATLGAGQAR